jgi:putative phosphoribosyl transferase
MPFYNRTEAGRQIALALAHCSELHPVVLALPRGGVPVAAEVARAFDAPLDLIIVRKIGVPFQPELAMGAVVDGPDPLVVRNEDVIRMARVSEADFTRVRDRELAEIQRRRDRYLVNRPHTDLKDRVVIVIDDGIATGATTRVALRAVRAQQPARLILAVPVAPIDVLRELQDEADEIVYLEAHEDFGAIGFYYADFRQIADDEVTAILAELAEAARRRETVAAV